MTATDDAGAEHGYLSNDATFAFVKSLEERNLVVPIIWDFAGPKAIRSVGAYLRANNEVVSAFYLSNVETYLWQGGVWMDFCRNAATLPRDESSTFIRAFSGAPNSAGFAFTSALTPIDQVLPLCP